jgi:hypothetical protein
MATYVPHLRIADNMDIYNIDMTNMNPTVSISGSNPLIVIEPPAPQASATARDNFNAVVVNLGMFAPRVNITFTDPGPSSKQVLPTLEGGFGSDPFNLSVQYTVFQTLYYLYQSVKEKKKLYINSTTNFVWVQISGFRATNAAGQKNITNYSIDMIVVGESSL